MSEKKIGGYGMAFELLTWNYTLNGWQKIKKTKNIEMTETHIKPCKPTRIELILWHLLLSAIVFLLLSINFHMEILFGRFNKIIFHDMNILNFSWVCTNLDAKRFVTKNKSF